MTAALAILSGFGVGLLGGMVGIGGGVVLVPLLVFGFGFSQHLAQGTSLAALVPTSMVGAITHLRERHMDVTAAAIMGAAGVLGVVAAALVAQRLPADALQRLFGIMLLFAAYRLVRREAGGSPPPAPSG